MSSSFTSLAITVHIPLMAVRRKQHVLESELFGLSVALLSNSQSETHLQQDASPHGFGQRTTIQIQATTGRRTNFPNFESLLVTNCSPSFYWPRLHVSALTHPRLHFTPSRVYVPLLSKNGVSKLQSTGQKKRSRHRRHRLKVASRIRMLTSSAQKTQR